MKTDIRITQKQMPGFVLFQSLSLLEMDDITLNRYLEEQIRSNPMLEYGRHTDFLENARFIDGLPDRTHTVYTELLQQLYMQYNRSNQTVRCAEYLIGNLEDDGYLRTDLETLSKCSTHSVSDLEAALKMVQQLSPAGVGARDLCECLLLQLRREDEFDACAAEIVQSHLSELASGKIRMRGYSRTQIDAAINHIRSLNPRPCQTIGDAQTVQMAIPSLEVYRDEQAGLTVRAINVSAMPILLRSIPMPDYADIEYQNYIRNRTNAARALINALQKRNDLLLQIGKSILRHQIRYFQYNDALAPLYMKTIASELNVHPSTISRAVRGKYILFRNSIFLMRDFFATVLSNGQSADYVKRRVHAILAEHGRISDQRIAEILSREGIRISRRCVNKYRRDRIRLYRTD